MSIEDIVATGELFTQQQGRQNWHLRKCVLSGIYLSYFDRTGDKRGQWDITDCVVRKISPEECKMPAAIHAFALICSKKYILLCASTESNRVAWMNILNEQIAEYKDPIRRFLQYGEVMYGHDLVKRRNMLGMYSFCKLTLTNYPRILVFEPASCVLKEQHSWSIDTPPLFTKVSETRFKISIRNKKNLSTKDLYFSDAEKGCLYWENVFRRFPDMTYYSHTKVRPSICIDFADTVSDKNVASNVTTHPSSQSSSKKGISSNASDITGSTMNNNASKAQAQQAAMALAMMHHNKKSDNDDGENDSQSTCSDRTDAVNREANKIKLRSLLHALKSIDNLLAHINDEIYNLDLLSLADSDHTSKNNHQINAEEMEAIEEHRQNKRIQLQILKDNVTVLSMNLKTIISNHNNNAVDNSNSNKRKSGIPISTSAQDLALIKSVGATGGVISTNANSTNNNNSVEEEIDLRNIEILIAETSKVLKVLHSSEHNSNSGSLSGRSAGDRSSTGRVKNAGSDRGSAGTAGSSKSATDDNNAKENFEWVRVEEHHLHPHQEGNSSKGNHGMSSHNSLNSLDSGHVSTASTGATAATAAVIAASSHTMPSHNSSHLLCALTENSSTAAVAAVAAAQLEFENIHITAKDSVAVDPRTKNRPPHWDKVKLKRVLIKEFVLELQNYLHHTAAAANNNTTNGSSSGSSSKTNSNEHDDSISQMSTSSHILKSRGELLELEEKIMTKEVNEYGRLLNMPILRKPTLEKAAIAITTDNFDEETLDRRPLAWQAVKLRRVMVREAGIRQLGKTSEFLMQKERKKMLIKEEELMLAEVAKTGEVVLTALEPLPLILQSSLSPTGTSAISGLSGATVSGTGSDMSGVTTDSNGSGSASGRTDSSGGSGVSLDMKELCISENNFDITTGKRPKGWSRIKHRRVSLREWQERSQGVKEDIIISSRSALEKEVEEEMIKEATVCSRVTAIEKRLQSNKHTGGANPLFPKGAYTGHTATAGTSERGRDGRIRTDTSNTYVASNPSSNALSLGSSSTGTSTANSLYELSLIHTVNQALESLSEQVSESLTKNHHNETSDTHSTSATPAVIAADNRGDETPPSVLKQQQLLQQQQQQQKVPMSSLSHQQQKESLQQQLEQAQLKEQALLLQSSSTTSSSSKSSLSRPQSRSHSPVLPMELQSPPTTSSSSTMNGSNKNYNQDQLLAQQALSMSTPKARRTSPSPSTTDSATNSTVNNSVISNDTNNHNPAVKLLKRNANVISDENTIHSARSHHSGIEMSSDSHKSTDTSGSQAPPRPPPPPPRNSARGDGNSATATPTASLSPYTSPRSPDLLPAEESFKNLTILQQKQQHEQQQSATVSNTVTDHAIPLKSDSTAHHHLRNGRHNITATIDSDDDDVEVKPPQKPPRRSLTPTSANYITDNMDTITATNEGDVAVPPVKPPRSRRNSLEPYL